MRCRKVIGRRLYEGAGNEGKPSDSYYNSLTPPHTYIGVVRVRRVVGGGGIVGGWLVVQGGRRVEGGKGSHPHDGEGSTHADLEGIGRVLRWLRGAFDLLRILLVGFPVNQSVK